MSVLEGSDLASELDDLRYRADLHEEDPENEDPLDADERKRMEELAYFLDDEIGNDDFVLIPEDEFAEYIRQLFEDVWHESFKAIEGFPETLRHNLTVDWDGVADDMASDYTSYTVFGRDYYFEER